ncbi:MAG TPA: TetR/AcrR family transcriptional regulator [Acidimicrobiales bacterium]|nr:TetR/AcrR family transcriptional regulator [Acidimicrobiales bacterium]
MMSNAGPPAEVDDGPILDLGLRLTGVPPVPPEELDPYLDAAARCFVRFGISRTRVPDVADEVGMSRVTVYRQVGTVENMARMLLARDMHRLLMALPVAVRGAVGPDAVVRLIETTIGQARAHPVLTKVLEDEPQLIGPVLVADLGTVAGRVADVVAPLLEALMDAGQLARRDARVVAEWLVRLTVTLILAPPPGDLRAFLAELIVPALAPTEEER